MEDRRVTSFIGPKLKSSKVKLVISGIPDGTTDNELRQVIEFALLTSSQDIPVGSKLVTCKVGSTGSGYALFSNNKAAKYIKNSKLTIGDNSNFVLSMGYAKVMAQNQQLSDNYILTRNGYIKNTNNNYNWTQDTDMKESRLVGRASIESKNNGNNNYNTNNYSTNSRNLSPSVESSFSNNSSSNSFQLPYFTSGSGSSSSNYTNSSYISHNSSIGDGQSRNAAKISFGENNSSNNNNNNNKNGGLSLNLDNGDIIFGRRTSKSQIRRNLNKLNLNVINNVESYNFINNYINNTNNNNNNNFILILGELDFSFSLSIINKIGNGHNVLSTSLHRKDTMYSWYKKECQFNINSNINKIYKYKTNYNNNKSIILRGIDALKLRETLIESDLGIDTGSIIAFDKVIFTLPLSAGSNHFDIRNLVFLKRLFENVNKVVNRVGDIKPELHLLMPIFGTRSQFESYKVEEIGRHCQLKWRLKDVIIFDIKQLSNAFNGYNARENCGKILNKRNNRYYGARRKYVTNNYYPRSNSREVKFMGYYIMEAI